MNCVGSIPISWANVSRGSNVSPVTSLVSIMKINASLIEQLSKDTQLRFHRVFLRTLVDRLSRTSEQLLK